MQKAAGSWKQETSLPSLQIPSTRLPLSIGVAQEAERHFLNAIEIASRQKAKSLELRAAISLGRLWQRQGEMRKAQELLSPIYNWFTEGFGTADLQDAKALLHEMET
jgi:predicted ATPase